MRSILLLIFCLSLFGCDSNSQPIVLTIDALPEIQTKAQPKHNNPTRNKIEPSAWQLTVTIGSSNVTMTPTSDHAQWRSGAITIDEANPVINVLWRYNDLLVADFTGTLPLTGRMVLNAQDYRTTGDGLDADNDGLSNFIELMNDFDPIDNQVPLSTTTGASIPYIDPADAPTIDGTFEAIWGGGSSVDWLGNSLKIDNLIQDNNAVVPDGQSGFEWTALHDGEYLYLMISGESSDNATLNADSTILWRDDSLGLFIDGDNSKLDSYDGINDYNWSIAHLNIVKPAAPYAARPAIVDEFGDVVTDQNGNVAILVGGERTFVTPQELVANSNMVANSPNRIVANEFSAPNQVELKFATCLCTLGRHVWELKVKLADVRIKVGRAFGLELQLDDDADGGDIEGRYGWAHPSIFTFENSADSNNTWKNPSYAGTAILMPPR